MSFFGFVIAIFAFQFVNVTFACDGYDVKVTKIINGKDNIAKIDPSFNTTLTTDCKLILEACVILSKPLIKAKVLFTAKKFFVPFYWETNGIDVCTSIQNMKIPVDCPIGAPGRYCSTKANPIDITDYKYLLPAANGDVTISGAQLVYEGVAKADTFDILITFFKK